MIGMRISIRPVAVVALAILQSFVVAPVANASPTVRNIVLAHGAFADGSSWAEVIPILQAKGFNVVAVQNPFSSLAHDVAATKRAIALQNGPVILVGHSWAGMVISQAGNNPKVAALVYVSALVPLKGQAAGEVTKSYPAAPGLAQARPDAAGYLRLARKGIEEDFVPDVSADERAVVYATQGPWNSAALKERVRNPAWMSKRSWLIVDSNDRMVPPQYERDTAKRIHATAVTLQAGHVPMLSMPDRVAAVIIDAANKAAAR